MAALTRPAGGVFVALCGLDGAGKSAQARLLAEALRAEGRAVTLTREPGGSPVAEALRRVVVEGDPDSMDVDTELLIFTAARRDHLRRTILPALARGEVVISDRFVGDTVAYQGAAGANRARIEALHAEFCGGVLPDLTLFLTVGRDTALARSAAKGAALAETRMERKDAAFHDRVRALFEAQAEGPGWAAIDASGPLETVAAAIRAALRPLLPAA